MEYKYISSIPKPLLNDFLNNKVIPFIGAGFSKNADIPEGLSMPDWNELGKFAADEIPNYKYDNNALDTLSYYEDLYSRTKLVELLMRSLHFGKVHPGSTYKAFCELFTGTICTTNFDSLIEEEMILLHRPVSVIVTKDRLTIGNNDESKVIKLHGDFNHPDRMVITEYDYDIFLEQNPIFATYIANLFITNTMLLIGYSLDDNDFRGIWQIINNRLGNMTQPAYCITVNATPEKIAKYKRRNIKSINLDGGTQSYKTVLHDFFVELKNYIDGERDKTVKSTDERINEQMIIPAEDNNLCFISCAMSRISRLSELINPVLQDLGITPVRIDDMLMPGDNWIDISQTVIRKSKAAIIDISDSSSNVMLELGFIKSAKQEKNVLIICEEGTVVPFVAIGHLVLTYSFDVTDEIVVHHFTKALRECAIQTFDIDSVEYDNNHKRKIFSNAYRLFEKGEYSACIVSAYSELEYQISLCNENVMKRSYSVAHYLMHLVLHLKQNPYDDKYAEYLIAIRNKIVHQKYTATEKEARDFLYLAQLINENGFNTQEETLALL